MRGFLITIVLGCAVFAGVAWYLDLPPFSQKTDGDKPPETSASVEQKVLQELGPALYKPAVLAKPATPPLGMGQTKDPIVVEGHNVILEKQDVPSKKPGQILFIGELIPEGTPMPPDALTARIFQGGKEVTIHYRRLEEGARVKEDQMVAMLDYSLALNDWDSKKAKIEAAQADYDGAIKTKYEAQARLDRADRLVMEAGRKGSIVSPEDYSAAMLTRDKYKYEEDMKKAQLKQSKIDAEQAQIIKNDHDIRDKIPGTSVIKTIYKHRGEAVKEQEPVLQLYNIDRLRAEGLVEVQYLDQLHRGMRVSIEPVEENAPLRVFYEHRGEVTSVAVSGDGKSPLIVSGSYDGTARVWDRTQARAVRVLYHPAGVRSVACSPIVGGKRWLLTGCTNGSLRLWDLNKESEQPVWDSTKSDAERASASPANPHHDGITAMAFSPDGKWFATGGEDNTMALWQTDGCKLLYTFDAEHGVENPHSGTITALNFTPQCQLVSASKDNTVRVWELREKGAREVGEPITGRGGSGTSVDNLGVSHDGQWALLDVGKVIQMMSLADRRTHGVIKNVGATPFQTLALFSPDASLILTAGLSEGRLQLWKAPLDGKRGFELRQFATVERSPVTCAAFAPDAGVAADGSFAVSGTRDGYVYIWQVPNRDQVAKHRMENLQLSLVEPNMEVNTRQARIGVNVQNPITPEYPDGRLIPGRPVHIVIEPE
jgi:WD40 repeat protein